MEKSAFENLAQHPDKNRAKWARVNVRARVIVACAVDASGNRLFSDADIASLQAVDGHTIQQLSDEAMAHVGWTDSDVEAMETTIKNSPETPAVDSPTS